MTAMITIDDLSGQLELIDQGLAALQATRQCIETALDEIPIKKYTPWGLPVEMGGHPDATRGEQFAFHSCDAIERLASGAQRGGKTVAGATELVMHITGIYPSWYPRHCRILEGETHHRPLKFRVAAISYDKGINDFIWPEIEKWLPASMRIRPKQNSGGGYTFANFPNSAEVSFLTYNHAVDDYTGWHGDGAWFDEAPPDREYYLEMLRGLMDNNARLWMTVTPSKMLPWLDQMFFRVARSSEDWGKAGFYSKKPAVFHLRLEDNPTITDDRKDHWNRRLDDRQRRSRILGESITQELMVLKNWDDDLHIVEPFKLPGVEVA